MLTMWSVCFVCFYSIQSHVYFFEIICIPFNANVLHGNLPRSREGPKSKVVIGFILSKGPIFLGARLTISVNVISDPVLSMRVHHMWCQFVPLLLPSSLLQLEFPPLLVSPGLSTSGSALRCHVLPHMSLVVWTGRNKGRLVSGADCNCKWSKRTMIRWLHQAAVTSKGLLSLAEDRVWWHQQTIWQHHWTPPPLPILIPILIPTPSPATNPWPWQQQPYSY